MDVREKLVEQAISHFWYGVSHDIFSEPVTTYAKLAIEALEKEKESGVMVQSGIDANTFRLVRECERLKEENKSISNAVNVLEEINSDLYKKLNGVTVQEWISVKDRLPEYGQPVLVCDVREDYVGMAVLQPAKRFVFSKSKDYWDWDRMECQIDEFTHWMPLPVPPKGE
jgi:hypothetical protein